MGSHLAKCPHAGRGTTQLVQRDVRALGCSRLTLCSEAQVRSRDHGVAFRPEANVGQVISGICILGGAITLRSPRAASGPPGR